MSEIKLFYSPSFNAQQNVNGLLLALTKPFVATSATVIIGGSAVPPPFIASTTIDYPSVIGGKTVQLNLNTPQTIDGKTITLIEIGSETTKGSSSYYKFSVA